MKFPSVSKSVCVVVVCVCVWGGGGGMCVICRLWWWWYVCAHVVNVCIHFPLVILLAGIDGGDLYTCLQDRDYKVIFS